MITPVPQRRKVFGLGLNKTGTTTLGACLKELGYRHTSASQKLLIDWSEGRTDRIWATIGQHDSFEDWPYPLMYREIMQRFGGNALYVLTTRKDPQTWLGSHKKHALRQTPDIAALRKIIYGIEYPQLDEERMLARYRDHNLGVIETAMRLGIRDRLCVLCWERGDGWDQLCSFLGVPVPKRPFPHENRDVSGNPRVQEANERAIAALAASRP